MEIFRIRIENKEQQKEIGEVTKVGFSKDFLLF